MKIVTNINRQDHFTDALLAKDQLEALKRLEKVQAEATMSRRCNRAVATGALAVAGVLAYFGAINTEANYSRTRTHFAPRIDEIAVDAVYAVGMTAYALRALRLGAGHQAQVEVLRGQYEQVFPDTPTSAQADQSIIINSPDAEYQSPDQAR